MRYMVKSTPAAVLTGKSTEHLTEIASPFKATVHTKAKEALFQLAARAAKAGFDLQVASSFRGFDHQLKNGIKPLTPLT